MGNSSIDKSIPNSGINNVGLHRNIVELSLMPYFVIDKDHVIILWNQACEVLTGYKAEQMLGTKEQWKPFYPHQRPCLADLLLDQATKDLVFKYYKNGKVKNWDLKQGRCEVEGFFQLTGQKSRWLRLTATTVYDAQGKTIAVLQALEDITEFKTVIEEKKRLSRELKNLNKKLKELVLEDPQTGLFNYRYFEDAIEAEFSRAKRYGQPLSITMLDIDYFKSINEGYGRQFGDLILKQLAKLLKKMVRRYDIIIRYSGEEFIIISPAIDRFQTMILAQRLLDKINPYNFGDKKRKVKLKVSLAVVSYPEEKVFTSTELVEVAERVLNKAKEYGGNRVCYSCDIKKSVYKPLKKVNAAKTENVQDLKLKLDKVTKRANQSLIEAVFAFAKTIELRDHYTGEHVDKTVFYATQIARRLNFSPDEIENVAQAAILHDLGKIGISDSILLKDSRLNGKEYSEIKKHPRIAADILRPIQFLHSAIPLILYHHERWDGKGYPQGLTGEDIPIGARIIAIADVYQALISNRPYRKSLSKEEAIEIIKKCSGTQFDPKIVKAFLKILQRNKNERK